MSNLRFEALDTIGKGTKKIGHYAETKITDIFAKNVFNAKIQREYLSEEAFYSLNESIQSGKKIDRSMADQIASAMKSWAMELGASHYTHWFQPLTGATAEKHDSFFTLKRDGTALEIFEGDALIQQEPDASSFPNGGIRATFEARGYTAWDPTSPAFIMEMAHGKTLCIPTIFIAYSGESLDKKTPLLKALDAVNKAAVDVCKYFDKNVNRVTASLGWEQEYFVVDDGLASARPDLIACGRTVLGHSPAKGQQLDDHYFGSIPERVFQFMQDFEKESYKLGIPLRTRHNEVAPSQFECAPIFEEANLAVDHNSLLMDVMPRVAKRHGLRVLMHEKPFAGVNGSGKHNNWSLSTNTGVNLLAPGKTPRTNLMFLTFFVNTIKAVHDHEELLRACIASAGNDHRLGANEAPPAIISVFIGEHLSNVLDEVESRVNEKFSEQDESLLKLDIQKTIPELLMDNTDRNRTSPFAFTGNKFEFRAVGSTANCATPMTVLNAIMAQTLVQFRADVDERIKKGDKKEIAILHVLRRYIKESKKIRFEGDNYSDAWAKEAKKRGLSNNKDSVSALMAYATKDAKTLFGGLDIYSEVELEARLEIELEEYMKKIQIEARMIGYLCTNHILPAAINYQNKLIDNIRGLKEVGMKAASYKVQKDIVEQLSRHINEMSAHVEAMVETRKKVNKIADMHKLAEAYCKKVKPYFDEIRYHADKLELIVADSDWPLPKYRELLFVK